MTTKQTAAGAGSAAEPRPANADIERGQDSAREAHAAEKKDALTRQRPADLKDEPANPPKGANPEVAEVQTINATIRH